MSSIIFYGAGDNAYKNFTGWHENGLTPVCFADLNIGKQYTYFYTSNVGNFRILPLLDAIKEYPDYLLYCTQAKESLADVTEYLLGTGIPIERIRYCDGFQEPSCCQYLEENFISVEADADGRINYSCCCATFARKTKFISSGNFESDYRHLLWYIEHLKGLLKFGYYTRCDECARQEKIGRDYSSVKNHFAITSGIYGGDVCNFNCVYCNYTQFLHKKRKLSYEIDRKYNPIELLNHIQNNYQAKNTQIIYAAGEIGMSVKYRDEILSIWNKNLWRGMISSNAAIFLPGIADLLEKKVVSLLTSLDSGTPETFSKIKRTPPYLFDKVVSNLERYAKTGGNVVLKYIILEDINDNENEVYSFLCIAKRLHRINHNVELSLSRDCNVSQQNISEKEINGFGYMCKQAEELGLKTSFFAQSFLKKDIEKIFADA